MADCETQTFRGITQAGFDSLILRAQSAGFTITGNTGVAGKYGVTVRWRYDPAGEILELQCTDLPFFLSCETVNGQLSAMVRNGH